MKPILFNTAMVQAILEGRKTSTRRIIKVNNSFDFIGCSSEDGWGFNRAAFGKGSFDKLLDAEIKERVKAPYMPGDILYVRETWQISNPTGDFARNNRTAEYIYKDGYAKGKRIPITREQEKNLGVWKPSIHMPKEAARIFLKVTSVKVQRLSDMEDEDYFKEGVRKYTKDGKVNKFAVNEDQYKWQDMPRNIQKPFFDLWNSTLKKEQLKEYGWESNPYVWVIEFERIDKSEVEQ